ncbi:MAG: glycoside hydrolase family 9 protein [Pseudomonadota bacterium]|nr:glycoside hydrolase family 9 protein [Pseudomonadota bacterium]
MTRRQLLQGASLLALPGRAAWPDPKPAPAVSAVAPASSYSWPVRALLQPDLRYSLDAFDLTKRVLGSLVIDDMEHDKGWVASDVVQLSYTGDRARQGCRSLRFSTEQLNLRYVRSSRRPNGSFSGSAPLFDFLPYAAWARLPFSEPQDWSEFNRLSLWCYVHPMGDPVTCLSLQLICEGAPAGPCDPIAVHYLSGMKQGEWNLLVWEFPEMRRDRVIALELFQPIAGLPFRKAQSRLTYDLDQLRLEKVDAEQVQGWQIAPQSFSFSHLGYSVGARKLAFVGSDGPRSVTLLDAETGQVVKELHAADRQTALGRYAVFDFSDVTRTGRYRLRSDQAHSESFVINERPWRPLVEATLNAYYGLRCGFAVPGAHDACHCNVFVEYKGDRRVVGGGWHDAANLTQHPENTALSVCALLDLSEALSVCDPELSARALEEARWGLEWILRMRFGPGLRCLVGEYSYFTDTVPGTLGDVVQQNVGSNTFKNLTAALAEARGARAVLKDDPDLAATLLRAAEEDFASVLRDRPGPPVDSPAVPNWQHVPWQNEAGYIALTAMELYRSAHEPRYAEEAVRFARWVLDLQEFRFVDNAAVTGYFYSDATRTRILHELQRTSGAPNSFEEGALLAYQALCEELPDHPEWIHWYSGLLAYSEYFCRTGSRVSAPFDLVPAAVWRQSDLEAPIPADLLAEKPWTGPDAVYPSPVTQSLIRQQMREQYEAATYLSPGQRLRVFPLWTDHVRHGASCVHLTKTLGLAAAAQGRRRADLSDLISRQLQWEIGGNPFSRSLVYGVGYHWWQNFTVSLPNLVGGAAVGMNCYRNDAPAWGNNAVFPYKEIWVLSSARWAANLARVPGCVSVAGVAPQGARLRRISTGEITVVHKGDFELKLPADRYEFRYGNFERELSLLDGARYRMNLDPSRAIDLEISGGRVAAEVVQLRIRVRGVGTRQIVLRVSNGRVPDTQLTVRLGSGSTHELDCPLTVADPQRPWVVVAIPDGRVGEGVEAFGTIATLREMGRSDAAA